MGSYAECWLESLYVGSTRNDLDYGLMQLFRASDKRKHRFTVKDLPTPLHHWASRIENPKGKIDIIYYTAPAFLIKDRLDLKGYTLSTAKRAFVKRVRAAARECTRLVTKGMEDYYENRRANLLKALDVDEWLTILRHIKEAGGTPSWANATPMYQRSVTLEDFMLQTDWYGFPGLDLNVPLRLALEVCTEKDNFVYDLTDLIDQGYLDKDEDFVALASQFTDSEYSARSRIIILTEGCSDGWILSESMKLLYPHLSDYFTFMDFAGARVEGGASHLARIVKSFAGAGIANRVIAIFDNDTAGEEAVRSLRGIELPDNLFILKLPELKMLRKYPTIGPSGRKKMNVNGLAASIELYLGEDVLREDGKLALVQWTGYHTAIGRYQGGVIEKNKIHERFKEKLARQKNCPNLAQDQSWSGLHAIMSGIFSAFHHFDQKLILAGQLEEYERE